MDISPIIEILQSFVFSAITILLPASVISIIVVIFVAIIMAAMQIQDQSLTFFPKTLSIISVILLLGPWMFGNMTQQILDVLNIIPDLIRA